MGVRILKDELEGLSCLYCSVIMWAFGGLFYNEEDPEDFLKWLDHVDPRTLSDNELEMKMQQWRENEEMNKQSLLLDAHKDAVKEGVSL